MAELEVDHLRKVYGTGAKRVEAIQDLTFSVDRGEFVSVVGPSGAGKTTLLRCLSGLLPPTSGSLTLAGEQVDGPPEAMALVFQNYSVSLLPWMSVEANVLLPLKSKLDKAERTVRARAALEAVRLVDFASSYPWQLSGGMQQRVAIARALAYRARVLLMDEPFASVDAQTRSDLEDLILRVHEEYAMTILFVTHDIDESIYLSDRVIVLSPRPTTIRSVIDVALPRPREQIATRSLADYRALRTRVFEMIRNSSASDTALVKGKS